MIASQKGQEMAIEVLVGVIMLSMVLVVSYLAIGNITEQRCVDDLRGEFNELANAINQVNASGPGREKEVLFTIPNCFDPNRSSLHLQNLTLEECVPNCGRSMSGCAIIQFRSFNFKERGVEIEDATSPTGLSQQNTIQSYCMDGYVTPSQVSICQSPSNEEFFDYGLNSLNGTVLRSANRFSVRKTIDGLCITDPLWSGP